MIFVVLSLTVLRPVLSIRQTIQEIAEDRAVLANRLQYSSGDEIGSLAAWFNKLLDKIESMLSEVQGYKNLLNAVPDPIFGVDDDYKIILANTATATLLKQDIETLKGQHCHDKFNTAVCQTENCPIAQSKRSGSSVLADIIDIGSEAKPHFIQPVSDVLRDSVDFYYRHVRGQTGQLKHLADCVGQGDSGRSDISTHVKKYVGESLDAKFTRAPAPARKPPAAKAKPAP